MRTLRSREVSSEEELLMVVRLQLCLCQGLGQLFDGRGTPLGDDQAALPSLLARVSCWKLKLKQALS